MIIFMDNDKSKKDGMTFDEFLAKLIEKHSGITKTSEQLKENKIKGEDVMNNKDFFTDDMEYIIKDIKTGETLCKDKVMKPNTFTNTKDKGLKLEHIIDSSKISNDKLQKGDKIEILEEPFMGIQGKIVDEVKLMNKFLVKIGDINSLYVDKDKVKLLKKKVEKKEFYRLMSTSTYENIKVTIRGRRTTVKLESGTQASVYCHKDDEYNEELAIKLAYNKARRKDLKKEYEKLLDKIEKNDIKEEEQKNKKNNMFNLYKDGELIAECTVEKQECDFNYRKIIFNKINFLKQMNSDELNELAKYGFLVE